MALRRSLGWPITLGTIMIVLLVALIVGWILLSVEASPTFADYWWGFLAVGTTLLVLVLVGVVLYLMISVKEINLNQRQSNFIDSVTHELKSPLASLKLYLQTLSRRSVPEAQLADFVRFMLDDVERLDTLINHMLEAARVEQDTPANEVRDVELAGILAECAATACQRYRISEETVTLSTAQAFVRARPIDVEMIFRNLIDNAIKYSGEGARVTVECRPNRRGDRVITRISDNGPGIPAKLRRKIFSRFVRLGSELERAQQGTGLGLFIVRTLVKRLRGSISVRSRTGGPGTVFEIDLPISQSALEREAPGAALVAPSAARAAAPAAARREAQELP